MFIWNKVILSIRAELESHLLLGARFAAAFQIPADGYWASIWRHPKITSCGSLFVPWLIDLITRKPFLIVLNTTCLVWVYLLQNVYPVPVHKIQWVVRSPGLPKVEVYGRRGSLRPRGRPLFCTPEQPPSRTMKTGSTAPGHPLPGPQNTPRYFRGGGVLNSGRAPGQEKGDGHYRYLNLINKI